MGVHILCRLERAQATGHRVDTSHGRLEESRLYQTKVGRHARSLDGSMVLGDEGDVAGHIIAPASKGLFTPSMDFRPRSHHDCERLSCARAALRG